MIRSKRRIRSVTATGLAGLLTASGTTAFAAPAARPNVILIYGDDVGYGDSGVYGATKIPTPNIDRLARNGLLFTDGHCSASTCTPSRFSLLTGRYAFREDIAILKGDATLCIQPESYTMADMFRAAGYKTGVIGKWHLGLGNGEVDWNRTIAPGPQELGFDYSFIMPATVDRVPCVYVENGRVVRLDPNDPIRVSYSEKITDTYPDGVDHPEAMTYYRSTPGFRHDNSVINGIGRIGWMSGGRAALWNDENLTIDTLRQTKQFITENKNQPFFLYFASQDIHVPRTPHKRFQGATTLGPRGDAMVQFDWATGEILKMLEENGLLQNTLVIFSSDNGPVYKDGYEDGCTVRLSDEESDHGHDGSGVFRGGKYKTYEGGTRVPFIVSWPGTVAPGTSSALISQVDLLASFAALTGQTLPAGAAIDSQNRLDTLLGKNPRGDDVIIEQANGNILSVRQGDWKYIAGKKGPELYDLKTDIGEQHNVAAQQPETVKQMAALLETYRTRGLRE